MSATDVAVERPSEQPPEPPPATRMCPATTTRGEFGLYAGGGLGNCSFPLAELPMHVIAVDPELYAKSSSCGSCIEVTGSRAKIVATVVDQMTIPPSPRGRRFAVPRASLVQLAGPGLDLVELDWRWVPCPATGSIMAALKDGSNQFYWEVQLTNLVNQVAKFEFSLGANSAWTVVARENYNYFRHTLARGLPLRLRLTDTAGNVVTTGDLKWPTAPVTMPISLGVQFPPACTP